MCEEWLERVEAAANIPSRKKKHLIILIHEILPPLFFVALLFLVGIFSHTFIRKSWEQWEHTRRVSVDTTDYSKPAWDRFPQATPEDVTAFATDFLQSLGYTLAGAVVCSTWSPGPLSDIKQYTCYAVYNPTWPPLTLTCGAMQHTPIFPLACVIKEGQ